MDRRKGGGDETLHEGMGGSDKAVNALRGGTTFFCLRRGPCSRTSWPYLDTLLTEAKSADLPVELPSTFELFMNLKTAPTLGLTIPPSLLFQANGVFGIGAMSGLRQEGTRSHVDHLSRLNVGNFGSAVADCSPHHVLCFLWVRSAFLHAPLT